MYEDYKLFGPYTRKDNRKVVILQHLILRTLKTVSYPKHLMECHLNRFLNNDETIDHINADFTDNRIENLQILSRAENAAKSFKDGTAHTGKLNLTPESRQKKSELFRGANNPLSKFSNETVLELRLAFKNKKISLKRLLNNTKFLKKQQDQCLKEKHTHMLKKLLLENLDLVNKILRLQKLVGSTPTPPTNALLNLS